MRSTYRSKITKMYFTVDHSTPMTSVLPSMNVQQSNRESYSFSHHHHHQQHLQPQELNLHLHHHNDQDQQQYTNMDLTFDLSSSSHQQQQANFMRFDTNVEGESDQLTTLTTSNHHNQDHQYLHHQTSEVESANLISNEFPLENFVSNFNPLDELESTHLFQPQPTSTTTITCSTTTPATLVTTMHGYQDQLRLPVCTPMNELTVGELGSSNNSTNSGAKPTETMSRVDLLNSVIQRTTQTQLNSSSGNSAPISMITANHIMVPTVISHQPIIQFSINPLSSSFVPSSSSSSSSSSSFVTNPDYQIMSRSRGSKRTYKGKLKKSSSTKDDPSQPPSEMGLTYPLMCVVCGYADPDQIHPKVGFHYGALSCEACKLFFRRMGNNQNGKDRLIPTCKTKDCEIFSNNRASCPECRYKKCIAVGKNYRTLKYLFEKILINIIRVIKKECQWNDAYTDDTRETYQVATMAIYQ